MTGAVLDARVLLGAARTARRAGLRRLAPEQAVVVALGVLACGWALRIATHDVVVQTPPVQLATSLATVAVVTGMLLAALATAASVALRPELAALAHRVGGRGLLLARTWTAATLAALATAVLLGVLVVGGPLDAGHVARLLGRSLPTGVALGCGLAVGVEAGARRLVRSRAVLGLGRFAVSVGTLAAAAALVARPGWTTSLLAAAVMVWTAVLVTGGVTPLRPQWLAQPRRARRPRLRPVRAVAAHPFWHPLVLLWRDALCVPAAAALIAVVGLAGVVGRLPSAGSLADLYVALWPLLVVVPASAAGLVAVAKASPVGGGLAGHRLVPRATTTSALLCAAVAATLLTLAGAVLSSVSGGSWMSLADLARFGASAWAASALALLVSAVRPVPAAVIDLPASTSLAHLGAASVLVGALSGARWPWLVAALALGPLAVVSLTTLARRRAPFTR